MPPEYLDNPLYRPPRNPPRHFPYVHLSLAQVRTYRALDDRRARTGLSAAEFRKLTRLRRFACPPHYTLSESVPDIVA